MAKKSRKNRGIKGSPPNHLGQHLLHNKKVISEIVQLAQPGPNEIVLEIGAGKGALTEAISQKAKKVLAVEYDEKFIRKLDEKMANNKNVMIIHQDILKMPLPRGNFIVISNIPYAITTSIMKKLLNNPSTGFQRGVIMMEKGAAKRFTSKMVKDPYVAAWRMWFHIRYVKEISRRNFAPPPKVDSAIIAIERKKQPLVPCSDYLVFWGLVDHVLKNPYLDIQFALKGIFTGPQIKRLKQNLRIKGEFPIGALSEQHWGIIYETMVKYVPKFKWPKIKKGKIGSY